MENRRTETTRQNDDSDMIESLKDAPDFGSRSGGVLQQNIGTQAELQHGAVGEPGVTRVRGEDKKEEASPPGSNRG